MQKLIFYTILLLFFASLHSFAQSNLSAGTWRAVIQAQGQEIPLVL